jgi:hypothetical protein
VTGDTAGAAGRAVVLAPGGNYGPDGPLLMFAAVATQRRGASPHPVTWDLEASDVDAMVCSRVSAAVVELQEAGTAAPVIVGKSLGSAAAPVAADRGLAAVWFTPLLTVEPVVAGLKRATAPFLLAGGTADDFWDGDVARSLTPHVVEIPGLDHRMFAPGPLKESAAALAEVITVVERFLDDVVWPG